MNPADLKSIAVLRALDPAALKGLSDVLESRDLTDGQSIFTEGDPGDAMFFLVSGSVRVEKQTDANSALRKTLTILEAGDYFGEIALFDQKPRSAWAVASGNTRVLRLTKAAFDALLARGGHAGLSLLSAMLQTSGDRIRRLSSQVIVYDEIGKAIGESKDLDELLSVVLRQLCRATLADWALVVLRAQFADRLELRGTVRLDLTAHQKEDVAAGKGILSLGMRESREFLVRNFDQEEPFKSCEKVGFETASLVLAPIFLENQSLGLIVLGGNQPDQLDLDDLNLTRGVARQAAQSILNARHREEEQARARHTKQFVRF